MDFKTYRFNDILLNYDKLRKPLSSLERENFQGEYPYYGAQGIIDYVADYRCDGEYLLIAEDGENLNTRNQPIATIAKGKFWVNNHAHVVKTNELADMRYTCYALNYMDIGGYVTGTAQPKLSQKNLNRIKVRFPSLEKQKNIADVLSVYDNLIENNNKRIKILEQMAENLYKEWFVRFRFPGHEIAEFEKQVPSGWVISSKETDMVCPIGWQYGKFSNLGRFIRGKNITASEMVDGDIPVISAGLEPSGYHNTNNVIGKSLTISASGANAGYLKYHLSNIWAADCSYYQDDKKLWFVYNALKFLQPVISNLQVGAAQPHVYPKNINKLCTIIPDDDIIQKYCDKVEPIYEQIGILNKKNENLIKQRDMLLPRLMSGKLEVKESQKKVVKFKTKKTFIEFKNSFAAAARKDSGLTEQDMEELYKAYCDDSRDE